MKKGSCTQPCSRNHIYQPFQSGPVAPLSLSYTFGHVATGTDLRKALHRLSVQTAMSDVSGHTSVLFHPMFGGS